MTHGGEILPFAAAQCDIRLIGWTFQQPCLHLSVLAGVAPKQCIYICLPFWCVVAWISLISWWKWQSAPSVSEKERVEGARLSICGCCFFFFPLSFLNWSVVFLCKLSETLQVQTPAVPPGPCQPPRLVGKPKARELQLRWGESSSNSDVCGKYLSLYWCN